MCGGRIVDNLEKTLHYSELLNIYGVLLSVTQREILEDYFLYNLSLSEIAENRKISRAAVEDAYKKGTKNLDEFENKLCSLKVLSKVHELRNNCKDENMNKQLDEIERILRHGI